MTCHRPSSFSNICPPSQSSSVSLTFPPSMPVLALNVQCSNAVSIPSYGRFLVIRIHNSSGVENTSELMYLLLAQSGSWPFAVQWLDTSRPSSSALLVRLASPALKVQARRLRDDAVRHRGGGHCSGWSLRGASHGDLAANTEAGGVAVGMEAGCWVLMWSLPGCRKMLLTKAIANESRTNLIRDRSH
ncbi:hypothetical protein OE88DRAFT_1057378 [Heliocybe sulcata]|uniref:Uncharacterized protein n=1 Tax=Heliocybe sulcata TaxID=5364 RepID=A0A5C3MLG0_9AGAM|nr:hypothetical protein OE88DRAFT_1057378 [Heliocybe sulcata]